MARAVIGDLNFMYIFPPQCNTLKTEYLSFLLLFSVEVHIHIETICFICCLS